MNIDEESRRTREKLAYMKYLRDEFIPVSYDSHQKCIIDNSNEKYVFIDMPLDMRSHPELEKGTLQIIIESFTKIGCDLEFRRGEYYPPINITIPKAAEFISKHKYTIEAFIDAETYQGEMVCGVADNIEDAIFAASAVSRGLKSLTDKITIKNTQTGKIIGTVGRDAKEIEKE